MTVEQRERRDKQRAYRKDNIIPTKNEYGITDTTPNQASKNILGIK